MCGWMVNSSGTTSVYTKGKKCKSDHGVRGPQKTCFEAYNIHVHDQVLRWERQRRCSGSKNHGPVVEKFCYNKISNDFLRKIEDKDKRRQKNGQTLIFS